MNMCVCVLTVPSGVTYYKMTNLDNRIQNPDQVLTQDVDKLCESLVDLYSNLSKVCITVVMTDYVIRVYCILAIVGYLYLLNIIGQIYWSSGDQMIYGFHNSITSNAKGSSVYATLPSGVWHNPNEVSGHYLA